ETWMKSRAISKVMWRIRSEQKKTAPFNTQRAMGLVSAKSALIWLPISATRAAICSLVINVTWAMCAKILTSHFSTQHYVSRRDRATSRAVRPFVRQVQVDLDVPSIRVRRIQEPVGDAPAVSHRFPEHLRSHQ